jgi:uncharacterized protein (DUF736 family)|tara:strand:+ start:101 stop:334 length:234 start_codon:yes stop_codon:yes gene_type:complete
MDLIMTKQYDNTNGGALFPNDKKQKESHPDYRGNINVDGTEYWIKGWKKTAKTGMRFLSLSLTKKEDTQPITEEDPF